MFHFPQQDLAQLICDGVSLADLVALSQVSHHHRAMAHAGAAGRVVSVCSPERIASLPLFQQAWPNLAFRAGISTSEAWLALLSVAPLLPRPLAAVHVHNCVRLRHLAHDQLNVAALAGTAALVCIGGGFMLGRTFQGLSAWSLGADQLQSVTFSGGIPLPDLTPLEGVAEVTLRTCQISGSLEPLRGARKLTIQSCRFAPPFCLDTELSLVAAIPHLVIVDMKLTHLDGLAGAPAGGCLELDNVQVSNLDPLAIVGYATVVLTSCHAVRSWAPLAFVPSVTLRACTGAQQVWTPYSAGTLTLSAISLRSVQPFATVHTVTLHALPHLTAIDACGEWRTLTLRACPDLVDLSGLANSHHALCVTLDALPLLSNLTGLGACASVDINNCRRVQQLGPLFGVPKVSLTNCHKITSLSALTGATSVYLRRLYGVVKVGCLRAVPRVTLLDCPCVTSIAALVGSVTHLKVANCPRINAAASAAMMTSESSSESSNEDASESESNHSEVDEEQQQEEETHQDNQQIFGPRRPFNQAFRSIGPMVRRGGFRGAFAGTQHRPSQGFGRPSRGYESDKDEYDEYNEDEEEEEEEEDEDEEERSDAMSQDFDPVENDSDENREENYSPGLSDESFDTRRRTFRGRRNSAVHSDDSNGEVDNNQSEKNSDDDDDDDDDDSSNKRMDTGDDNDDDDNDSALKPVSRKSTLSLAAYRFVQSSNLLGPGAHRGVSQVALPSLHNAGAQAVTRVTQIVPQFGDWPNYDSDSDEDASVGI